MLDEGQTVQDYLDQFSPDQGSSWFPPFVTDLGAKPPTKPGETSTWEASLTAGEYLVMCQQRPDGPMFGFGLTVVDG